MAAFTSATARTGLGGHASINGTDVPVIQWSHEPAAQVLGFVNSLSGNHPVRKAGITDGGMFTIDLDYSDDSQPFASPLSIVVGTTITNVKLYVDGPSGTKFKSIPSAVVQSTPMNVVVAGKIGLRIVALTDGKWAEIGGSLQ